MPFVALQCSSAAESKNCKNELELADSSDKKIAVLMFERFSKSDREMGGVGFIVWLMVRFNCYKQPDIFQNKTGQVKYSTRSCRPSSFI